ncbi:MAG: hypothetical protein ACRDYB_05555 [Acidimicrobiales bacterium]
MATLALSTPSGCGSPRRASPGGAVTLVGVGALVLANPVAAIPTLTAARTPAGLLLRDE